MFRHVLNSSDEMLGLLLSTLGGSSWRTWNFMYGTTVLSVWTPSVQTKLSASRLCVGTHKSSADNTSGPSLGWAAALYPLFTCVLPVYRSTCRKGAWQTKPRGPLCIVYFYLRSLFTHTRSWIAPIRPTTPPAFRHTWCDSHMSSWWSVGSRNICRGNLDRRQACLSLSQTTTLTPITRNHEGRSLFINTRSVKYNNFRDSLRTVRSLR